MDKHGIASILYEMGVLLDLLGENTFKVRAYENAARTLEGVNEDIGVLIDEDRLISIKGIGKNLAEHIAEIYATGKLKEHEKLKKEIPNGVIEMLRIPGLGPKKIHYIWKILRIKSVGELAMACKRHMLRESPGFGEKTEEKILAGIESIKKFAGQWLYIDGKAAADEIFDKIRKFPGVIRAEICGSIRRKKELIKDIDILVSSAKPKAVMDKFVNLPQVESIVQHGDTKSAVILKSGINCDLRVVSDAEFTFALHHFTGSKEHNVAMRSLAKKNDLKLNEYGLFKGSSEKSASCKTEKEIFAALKLSYIEPEMREDRGELDAAAKNKLPDLINFDDIQGVAHVHSQHSDGTESIAEIANGAQKLGYKYVVITDHSQAVSIAHGLKPQAVIAQHREIDELNKKLKGFRIFKGTEVDIMAEGELDYDDELLSTFDVVIAAVHSRFGMNEKDMTARIVKAVSNPNVDILAHPTGRLLLSREPYAVDMKAVIGACAKHKTAIEINAQPQRLDLDWRLCKYAKEQGVKIVICPDAHSLPEFAFIELGIGIARKGWLEKKDVLNCLPANEFSKYFKTR